MPADSDRVADLAVARHKQRQLEAATRKDADEANHHEIAQQWIERHTIDGHAPKFTDGAFYLPDSGGLWVRKSIEEGKVSVARHFAGGKLCRKESDFRQIAQHIADLCEIEGFFGAADTGVASPGGFHRVGAGGEIETVELSLGHRQSWRLPWVPLEDTPAPLLEGVLGQAFAGDHADEQADLFWQALGASLFGLMPRFQTVVLLLGRERSGKSLLQRIVERTVPETAVGAVSPASWGHEYHVAALAGKRLNIVGELSDDAPIPAAAFKNVTGQNLVAGRHPTHRPFAFRCMAAHWFASNVLPPTTDRSEAFYRRFRVLRFANTVPADKVDPELFEKIVDQEMPAILGKAFRGAERAARGRALRSTPAHAAVLERWRQAANPIEQFLADTDWVELDGQAHCSKPEAYETYRKWSQQCGFRHPFGRNHFLELLEATGGARGILFKRLGTKEVVVGLRLVPRA